MMMQMSRHDLPVFQGSDDRIAQSPNPQIKLDLRQQQLSPKRRTPAEQDVANESAEFWDDMKKGVTAGALIGGVLLLLYVLLLLA